MKKIVVTGSKGGTGKSTICALLAQWFLYKKYTVDLIDLDTAKSISVWIQKCQEKKYDFISKNADIQIIDTAGRRGADSIAEISKVSFIIVPFIPHISDLQVVLQWFSECNNDIKRKIIFIPNKKQNIKEQKEGLKIIESNLQGTQATLLSGFSLRSAVFAPILNGRSRNFFDTLNNKKCYEEIKHNFTSIKDRINNGN